MSSQRLAAKAPKPIGLTDDFVAFTLTTPVLPPASPKRNTATTQHHLTDIDTTTVLNGGSPRTSSTTNNISNIHNTTTSTTSSPNHRGCTTADHTPLLPAFVTNTGVRSSASCSLMQQQHSNAARRSSFASENSMYNLPSATPSLVTSPTHRTAQECNATIVSSSRNAGFTTVTNTNVVHPAIQHVMPMVPSTVEYDVLEDFATSATVPVSTPYLPHPTPSPVSAKKSRLAGKPPMMNPNLFTSGPPGVPVSPSGGRPADFVTLNGNAAGCGMTTTATAINNSAVTPTLVTNTVSVPTTPAEPSRTNLIVYNIGPDMTEDVLHELFDVHGEVVSCAVMRDIHTGQSLGTGFVRFATNAEARRALFAFNDRTKPLFFKSEKPLAVQWARKQHDDTPVGDARKKIMKLFVRNIPLDCTVEMLEELFGKYGSVRQVTVHKDTAPVEDPAMERLIAFVIFTEEGAAERAATAVHNTKPFPSCNGIPVMIKLAENSQRRRFLRNGDGTTMSAANSPMAGISGGYAIQETPAMSPTAYTVFSNNTNNINNAARMTFNSINKNSTVDNTTSSSLCATSGMQNGCVTTIPAAAAVSQVPLHFPSYTTLSAQPHDLPPIPDNVSSSYAMPVAASPSSSAYAQPEMSAISLTADDYGLNGPQRYTNSFTIPTNHPTNSNTQSNNSDYGNNTNVGFHRSASYTQLPQRTGQHVQNRCPYYYEDVGSVDSLSRMNTFSNDGCTVAAVSSTHSRLHAPNSLDASLTGYGTDRTSVSSKSTATNVGDNACISRGSNCNTNNNSLKAVHAVSTGPRNGGASARSWFSSNDSTNTTTNTSSHSATAMTSSGYPFSTSSEHGSGYNSGSAQRTHQLYNTGSRKNECSSNGNKNRFTADALGNGGRSQPNYNLSGRTRARALPPAPAIVPTAAIGGINSTVMNNNNSGSTNSIADGEKCPIVPYHSYSGTAHPATSANTLQPSSAINSNRNYNSSSGNTSISTAANGSFIPPVKTVMLMSSSSVSSSGNTLCTMANENNTSYSSTAFPIATEPAGAETAMGASENRRQVMCSHAQHQRLSDMDTCSPATLRDSTTELTQQYQDYQQSALMLTSPVYTADPFEVIPMASPPMSPSAGVNPRLASVTAKFGEYSSPRGGSTNLNSGINNNSDDNGGSGSAAAVATIASPSNSACKRYYNNPYCLGSPKLYC